MEKVSQAHSLHTTDLSDQNLQSQLDLFLIIKHHEIATHTLVGFRTVHAEVAGFSDVWKKEVRGEASKGDAAKAKEKRTPYSISGGEELFQPCNDGWIESLQASKRECECKSATGDSYVSCRKGG